MNKKYPERKQLDLTEVGKTILEFWEKENIFEKSISHRAGKTAFVFYEGPPSANGLPGIHHVMSRSIKDIFCRYKTLQGFQVKRKAGWDTHGLPVELGVEKELGINKEDIGKKISVTEYNAACKKAVMRYTEKWNELTKKIGYWTDTENPYITYTAKYIESVWWLLGQLHETNKLYKGYSIQPYSPKAGTGLSSHELNQPGCYRMVKDTSIVAQFEVSDLAEIKKIEALFNTKIDAKVYFLAWTTTPWTLPSNTALALGEKINYVLVKTQNPYTSEKQYVILAENCTEKQFTGGKEAIAYTILGKTIGKNLAGIKYSQLMPYALPYKDADKAFRVIIGDFVTTQDGTGIVHIAPTFGADDMRVAQQNGIPPMLVLDENKQPVPLVNLQGKFRPEMKELANLYVKHDYYADHDAPDKPLDVLIAIALKDRGQAFKIEKYEHSYPHCWRTDKPILYYPLDAWFVKVAENKARLIELNNTINWTPESTGTGRFGNWLENANDWNLSRSRYWGIPLPIWRTADKSEEICISSLDMLKTACEKSLQAGLMQENPLKDYVIKDYSDGNYENIDLHKPFVDQIILVSATGKPMYRESDLIDVWFDSGAMPYAQQHYPFSQLQGEKPASFPADFIAEGVDQTRGWFYTLHLIAGLCFDSVAYKNVLSNGLVLDKNGQKMSKRLGNTVEPFETLNTYGADATRWYMITNALPWDNLKFDLEGIAETQRKFFRALHNTYNFFALYANLDAFDQNAPEIAFAERPQMDQWIISKLNSLIENVKNAFEKYDPTHAGRLIQDFTVDELSNWYVRLSRRRFWLAGRLPNGDFVPTESTEINKLSAYQTLYECLKTVAILASPIAPFYTDQLFKDLTGELSVHLADFPVVNFDKINSDLMANMELAQRISSMTLSLRKREKINVRQPLQKIVLPNIDFNFTEDSAYFNPFVELILAETNIKEIQIINDTSGVFAKSIQANFRNIGAKYGKLMKAIAEKIKNFTAEDIQNIEKDKLYKTEIEGQEIVLTIDDFIIATQDLPGYAVAVENGLIVGLDITLTENLQQEGLARELINRIQNYRKTQNFEILDKINLIFEVNSSVKQAIENNFDYIKDEVLASSISFGSVQNTHIEEEIQGNIKIEIQVVPEQ